MYIKLKHDGSSKYNTHTYIYIEREKKAGLRVGINMAEEHKAECTETLKILQVEQFMLNSY